MSAMVDLRRLAVVTFAVVALSVTASVAIVLADAPIWLYYIFSAFLTGVAVMHLLMPGRGVRFGRLARRDRRAPAAR